MLYGKRDRDKKGCIDGLNFSDTIKYFFVFISVIATFLVVAFSLGLFSIAGPQATLYLKGADGRSLLQQSEANEGAASRVSLSLAVEHPAAPHPAFEPKFSRGSIMK
jgi:hypothetical protein